MLSAVTFGSTTVTATVDGVSGTALVNVLHDPIVFVHGFGGSGAIWTTMIDRLKADGWTDTPLVTWTYDSNQSNVTIAQQLQAKVDSLLAAVGAKKVDIVSHSMGGLSARYYSKNLGGSEKIDAFVALGTPNHGTTVANLCPPIQPCIEMRPGSAFLTALNAGDETPGSARYATWWTPCDQVTTPPESVILDGATNTKTACMTHSDLYSDATVYGQVRDWVK
jgi:triacylglycerol lipase